MEISDEPVRKIEFRIWKYTITVYPHFRYSNIGNYLRVLNSSLNITVYRKPDV